MATSGPVSTSTRRVVFVFISIRSLGLAKAFEMAAGGAEIFCRSLATAPDTANQASFFGQLVGRTRLGRLGKISLQSFADECGLGLSLHPRTAAKALPQRLRDA